MSSMSQRKESSKKRSLLKGTSTLANVKTRFVAVFALLALTTVLGTTAFTVSANQPAAETTTTSSGYVAAAFNDFLSLFGFGSTEAVANDLTRQDDAAGCDKAPSGLVACYKGESDTSDVTGRFNGEWVGTFGYGAGKDGGAAFSFGGGSQIVVPNAAELNPANLTLDGWVNLSNLDGTFGLISKGDAFSLQVRDGQVVFVSTNAEGVVETLESGKSVKTSDWVHLAATHDGGTRRIYINGEEVASAPQAGLFTANESDLVLGATQTNAANYVVLADEVKLFDRALTEDEIKANAKVKPAAPDATDAFSPLTITPNPVAEGASTATVSVTRTNAGGALGSMIVNLSTTPGTATHGASCAPGVDYVFGTPSVSFGPNEPPIAGAPVTKTVDVTICQDALAEGDETFTITATLVPGPDCTPATCEVVPPAPVLGTITDDDLVVQVTSVTGPVLENSGTNLTYTFSRNGSGGPTTVAYSTAGTAEDGNPALPPSDYVLEAGAGTCLNESFSNATNSGTIEFAAGDTTCTLSFDITGDTRVEPNETLIVTAQPGVGYTVGATAQQTGTITNDDFAVVDFGTDPGADEEGNPFPAGTFNFDFDRVVPADSETEALTVTFTLGGTATGTNTAAQICTGAAGSAIDYTLAGGQTDGGTFNPATCTGTVTFAAGDDDADVQLVATADTRIEPDETILGTVVAGPQANNGNTYTIGADDTDTATIDDDDEYITVVATDDTESEAGPGSLVFEVTRNWDSSGGDEPVDDALTVTFSLSGTATGGTGGPCANGVPVDYTVTTGETGIFTYISPVTFDPTTCTGTITFGPELGFPTFANDTTALVFVTPVNDTVPENNETVTLSITGGTTVGDEYGIGAPGADGVPSGTAADTGTIVNDDVVVSVQVAPAAVNEGNTVPAGDENPNLVYTFTRVGETADLICVNFSTSGTGADATTDYVVTFGTATACPNSFTPVAGASSGVIGIPGGAGNPADVGGVQANQNTVIVNPTDDDVVEPNEEVQVQVNTGTGYTPGTPNPASGLIVNDDSLAVSVEAIDPTAVEGNPSAGDTLTFRFCRANGANNNLALTVVYNVSGLDPAGTEDAAASADDIVPPPFFGNNLATIPAGAACTSAGSDVVIDPVNDPNIEADEWIRVTVQDTAEYNAGIVGTGNITADGEILNDDNTVACSVVAPASVNEGGSITYRCVRTGGGASFTADQSLTYTVGGSATGGGVDYTIAPATFSFTGGSDTADVVVSTVNDALPEADETVTVDVDDQTVGVQGFDVTTTPDPMVGTILNNDQNVSVSGGGTVSENGTNGPLVYTFTRDFGANPPNALSGPVTVNFTVNAGNNTPEATAPGAVAADCDGSQGGGNLGVSDFSFSAFSDAGNTVPTTFVFTPGTCSGTITFPDGDTTVTLVATPINDAVTELNENVVIAVATGANYAPTGGAATGVIANDDVTFSVSPAAVTGGGNLEGHTNLEVDNNLTPHGSHAVFTVTRTGNLATEQRIDISTIPTGNLLSGTATSGAPNTPCGGAGIDYITDGDTLVFAPGDDTEQFFVAVCGDTTFELDETINVQLTNPNPTTLPGGGAVNVPTGVATWVIVNDDNAVGLRALDDSADEGQPLEFQVCLQTVGGANSSNGVDTTFDYTTSNGTATAGDDYTAVSGSETIPAGQSCVTIPVATSLDNLFEGSETVNFTISNAGPTAGGLTPPILDANAVGTINDLNSAPTVTIGDVSQAEGNGGDFATTFNFPLTLSGGNPVPYTVCWTTQDGNATIFGGGPNPATGGIAAGTQDYTAVTIPNCFTFAANPGGGSQTYNIPIVVNGDAFFEFDETFSVILSSLQAGSSTPVTTIPVCPVGTNPTAPCVVGDNIGVGTIQNDDLAPSVTISTPGNNTTAVMEGQVFPFTFTQSAVSGRDTTFTFATASGTATSAANCTAPLDGTKDFIGVNQTVTIPAGQTTATVNVTTCNDSVNEPNETFTGSISNIVNAVAGATTTRTANITDNDQAAVYFFSDANGNAFGDVSEFEGTPPTATTPFTFYLSRSGNATTQQQVVTAQTVDGTATDANNDYEPRTCTFTFNPGDTIASCVVTVNPDATQEGDETFTLQITNITNLGNDSAGNPLTFAAASGLLGADFVAQGNILNDDGNRIFTVRSVTEVEGTDPALPPGTKIFVFRVEAQGQSVQQSTLTYQVLTGNTNPTNTRATVGSTCAGTVDVINTVQASTGVGGVGGTTGTLTFGPSGGTGAGNEFIDILVPVCMDARDEINETFRVVLTAVTNSAVSNTSGTGVGTIIDDDGATYSLVASSVNINEGNVAGDAFTSNATITVQQNGENQNPPTVTYFTQDGTAIGAANCSATPTQGNPDYRSSGTAGTPTSGQTFGTASGSTVTIQIPICGDTFAELDETFTVVINAGGQILTATVNIINDDGPVVGPTGPPWEGDINRANPSVPDDGDGVVDNVDLFWYSEFAEGRHCPSEGVGGEFQRLDGNDSGGIDSGDYTYIFNRWIGLASLEAPKGPTARPAGLCTGVPTKPSEEGKVTANGSNAVDATTVRVVSTGGQPGQQVLVPILVESDGTLDSMGVTVTYDPAVLSISGVDGFSNPDVLEGPGAAPNQVIGVNSTTGSMIVGLDFTGNTAPAVPLPSGTRQVAYLRFTINANATVGTSTPVTITPGTTVDINGNIVTGVTATNGTVTIAGPRSLVIGDSSTTYQDPAAVPVTLNGAGGEFGVSFTANFDPTLASIGAGNVTFAPAVSGANCSRTVATQQVAIGRIGISISCDPQGAAIPSGTLVTLTFTPSALATPGSVIPVTFGDVPLQTNVTGATGAGLPFTRQNGNIFILGPTSASVSVTGRVVTESGAGIRGASVIFTDSQGNRRSVTTSTLGYYEIAGVEAGQTYVVTAAAKRFRFQARTITVDDSLTEVNLVGIE